MFMFHKYDLKQNKMKIVTNNEKPIPMMTERGRLSLLANRTLGGPDKTALYKCTRGFDLMSKLNRLKKTMVSRTKSVHLYGGELLIAGKGFMHVK